jgi:hypothetical protein
MSRARRPEGAYPLARPRGEPGERDKRFGKLCDTCDLWRWNPEGPCNHEGEAKPPSPVEQPPKGEAPSRSSSARRKPRSRSDKR